MKRREQRGTGWALICLVVSMLLWGVPARATGPLYTMYDLGALEGYP